jgi:hypothetical protein
MAHQEEGWIGCAAQSVGTGPGSRVILSDGGVVKGSKPTLRAEPVVVDLREIEYLDASALPLTEHPLFS